MPKLYVVATPIGNLSDMSPRVTEAFTKCDLIAAEDTRVTMKLLSHLQIQKPLISCHRHNEENRAPELVARMLQEDLTVALCSDAGTPAVSDPGNRLVEAAWEAGIPVEPVCGPSAAMTALSAAGFFAREFAFLGFPPREKKELSERMEQYRRAGASVLVLYESPHRIDTLVERIADIWPGTRICVCCDLSKRFERIDRGICEDVLAALRNNPNREKGEYCAVVECPARTDKETDSPTEKSAEEVLLGYLLAGMDERSAADAAIQAGCAKNAVKRARLRIKALAERMTADED